mmetsp:Transcript_45771/g.53565  ORF Transcript_45771/g.53565 Transcript_45771/m.53565 type:complete len:246 (-) Transcript_45771:146-883(-)|eukprot:CAMPEP_0194378778 /NCGR_PEP_ID=MMETSP0174-20130528/37074_1 /TAXON_ID=216777 /ORGANISM="Proboscia alata, Strain PI-D3" /LENGTH=245 /DNA_ID=CAMNT_0039161039 /DNA_START=80 /DNA_END=817 /DNA_ORIENTATION=-
MISHTVVVALLALFSFEENTSSAFSFESSKISQKTLSSLSKENVIPHRKDLFRDFGKMATAAFLTIAIIVDPGAALADGSTKEFKLPPIDFSDKSRCQFASSKMGQANAARDKLYDLRQCNLAGKDASGFDLSGVIMTGTDVSKAKFVDTQFSKAYLHESNFDGADFSNGVIDRASFKGSTLRGAVFVNAVLTGTSFEGANVENADFSDSYIGDFDVKSLCRNPTLKGENPTTGMETRASVGCRN